MRMKYGMVASNPALVKFSRPLLVTTGTVFKNSGGQYMYNNAGALSLATGDVVIVGAADVNEHTSAAGEKVQLQMNPVVPSWLPIIRTAGAITEGIALGLIGKRARCLIGVDGIQRVDLDTTGTGLIIEYYDIENQALLVSMETAQARTSAV